MANNIMNYALNKMQEMALNLVASVINLGRTMCHPPIALGRVMCHPPVAINRSLCHPPRFRF